jgi:hypothetical protein
MATGETRTVERLNDRRQTKYSRERVNVGTRKEPVGE